MAKMEKERETNFKTLDDKIDSVLLESRRIFFFDMVDNQSAYNAIRKLWYLELTNPGKPITFIINSPGGSIDAGFAIWDQAMMIGSPIITLVTGLAASMGSVLSLCASAGKRFATPNSRFMIHQPSISGPMMGQATDLEIQALEILRTRDILTDLYSEHTGRTRKEIEKALDRDKWMNAKEALAFGLLDKIVSSLEDCE